LEDAKTSTFGRYGSRDSRREYARALQEWETRGHRLPEPGATQGKSDLTMNELVLAYWKWATERYVKDGKPTNEPDTIRQAMRYVKEL
jgi:hypothetical protein